MREFTNPSFDCMWDAESPFPVAFLYDSRIPAELEREKDSGPDWPASFLLLVHEIQLALRA